MSKAISTAISALVALLLGACALHATAATAAAAANPCARSLEPALASVRGQGAHPLLGQMILAPRAAAVKAPAVVVTPVTPEALLAAADWTAAPFVLLGEIHDNPTHHALRAAMIEAWRCLAPDRRASAVFEHIRQDQERAIAAPPDEAPATAAAALLDRLAWASSNWPDAAMFKPLFAAAIQSRLAIRPGEPAAGRVRALARGGLSILAPDEIARLGLRRALEPDLAAALAVELKASHCNLIPDSVLPALALSQRYRDAHLAHAMREAAGEGVTVFLLAGNGHVRFDRGVPWHLATIAPQRRAVSIMLVEVHDGRVSPQDAMPRDPSGRPAADIVIFTPPTARPDPCASMKAGRKTP